MLQSAPSKKLLPLARVRALAPLQVIILQLRARVQLFNSAICAPLFSRRRAEILQPRQSPSFYFVETLALGLLCAATTPIILFTVLELQIVECGLWTHLICRISVTGNRSRLVELSIFVRPRCMLLTNINIRSVPAL